MGILALLAMGASLSSPTGLAVGGGAPIAEPGLESNSEGQLPVARDERFTVWPNQTFTLVRPGVLWNDFDPNGNPLKATAWTAPTAGTLDYIMSNGQFQYTAPSDAAGTATFTYRATDGVLFSDPATVSVRVTATGNTRPVSESDEYVTPVNTILNAPAPGVMANDYDLDGDSMLSRLYTAPSFGSVVLNCDGSFQYTPNPGFEGIDRFTYRAYDVWASAVTTVMIRVGGPNAAPRSADDAYAMSANAVLNVAAPGVLANDGDADLDPLTAVLIGGPLSGTLTLQPDGSFTYTPNAGFSGTDSFTYAANDGLVNGNTATVTIDVQSGAPVALDDFYTVKKGVSLTLIYPGVRWNDYDPDYDPFIAVLDAEPTNGALTLDPNGSFAYTPKPGFKGADTFTYYVTDGVHSSNLATVTIRVTAAGNKAPSATADSYSAPAGGALIAPIPGMLGNDSDRDGDSFMTRIESAPLNGAFLYLYSGWFRYIPNPGFSGVDSFTYRAYDGLNSPPVTVSISVTP